MILSTPIFNKSLLKQTVKLRMSNVTSYMSLHVLRTSSRVLTQSIGALAAYSPKHGIPMLHRLLKEVEERWAVTYWDMDGKCHNLI